MKSNENESPKSTATFSRKPAYNNFIKIVNKWCSLRLPINAKC